MLQRVTDVNEFFGLLSSQEGLYFMELDSWYKINGVF